MSSNMVGKHVVILGKLSNTITEAEIVEVTKFKFRMKRFATYTDSSLNMSVSVNKKDVFVFPISVDKRRLNKLLNRYEESTNLFESFVETNQINMNEDFYK